MKVKFDAFVGSPLGRPTTSLDLRAVAALPAGPAAPAPPTAPHPDPPPRPAPPRARPARSPGRRSPHVRFHVSLPAGAQTGSTHAPAAEKVGQTPPLTWPALLSYPRHLPPARSRDALCSQRDGAGRGGGGPGPRAPGARARADLPVLLPPPAPLRSRAGKRERCVEQPGTEWKGMGEESDLASLMPARGRVRFHAFGSDAAWKKGTRVAF